MILESTQPGYLEYLMLNSEHQYEIYNCDLVDESEKKPIMIVTSNQKLKKMTIKHQKG